MDSSSWHNSWRQDASFTDQTSRVTVTSVIEVCLYKLVLKQFFENFGIEDIACVLIHNLTINRLDLCGMFMSSKVNYSKPEAKLKKSYIDTMKTWVLTSTLACLLVTVSLSPF